MWVPHNHVVNWSVGLLQQLRKWKFCCQPFFGVLGSNINKHALLLVEIAVCLQANCMYSLDVHFQNCQHSKNTTLWCPWCMYAALLSLTVIMHVLIRMMAYVDWDFVISYALMPTADPKTQAGVCEVQLYARDKIQLAAYTGCDTHLLRSIWLLSLIKCSWYYPPPNSLGT